MKKKLFALIGIMLIAATLAVGCGNNEVPENTEVPSSDENSEAEEKADENKEPILLFSLKARPANGDMLI